MTKEIHNAEASYCHRSRKFSFLGNELALVTQEMCFPVQKMQGFVPTLGRLVFAGQELEVSFSPCM